MKRNGRKGDLFAEVAVGVFMLGIIALLAYFTIIISGVDVLHGRHKVVAKVEFTDVGGLKNQDSCRCGDKSGCGASRELPCKRLQSFDAWRQLSFA